MAKEPPRSPRLASAMDSAAEFKKICVYNLCNVRDECFVIYANNWYTVRTAFSDNQIPLCQSGHSQNYIDQTPVETRPDVLLHTSAPLTEELYVTGPLFVTLFVSSDMVDTDFTAKLTVEMRCALYNY